MTPYKEKFDIEVREFNAACKKSLENFKQIQNNFEQQYTNTIDDFQKSTIELNKTLDSIKDIEDSAKQNLSNIKELYNEIVDVRDKIIKDKSNDELSILSDIKDSHEEINNIYDKISKYNDELFGYKKEKLSKIAPAIYSSLAEDERRMKGTDYYKIEYENIPGIKDAIQKMIADYNNFIKEEKEHIETRERDVTHQNEALYKKIENLLPGATAAGLAAAYESAKNESRWRIIVWSCGFIISLVAFAVLAWILIHYKLIDFTQEMSFQASLSQLMRAACFELPCIWFAWAANIKVSQYTRLNEEYRHKWAMMRVFDGMRSALEATKDANEDNNVGYFYRVLLDSFSNNPSKTLDKKYSPDGPFSFIDKILKKTDKQNDVDVSNTTSNPQ